MGTNACHPNTHREPPDVDFESLNLISHVTDLPEDSDCDDLLQTRKLSCFFVACVFFSFYVLFFFFVAKQKKYQKKKHKKHEKNKTKKKTEKSLKKIKNTHIYIFKYILNLLRKNQKTCKKRRKKASKGTSRDGSILYIHMTNVTRNRAAVEAKKKNWTLKVALARLCVVLPLVGEERRYIFATSQNLSTHFSATPSLPYHGSKQWSFPMNVFLSFSLSRQPLVSSSCF